MKLIIYDNVRYLLSSSTEESISEFHKDLPKIKADIVAMRATQIMPQKAFHRMGNWDIKEHFGITTVTYHSKLEQPKKKLSVIEETNKIPVTELIPYLICDDGILLCEGDLNFNGPYTHKNFYDKSVVNYWEPYAPYCFPITANNISYWSEEPPPVLGDEELLEWQIKKFKETVGTTEYEYDEPDFYGVEAGYCPAYWHGYPAYYAALLLYWEDYDNIPPTFEYGYGSSSVVITDINDVVGPISLVWGWSFLPAIYEYYDSYIERVSEDTVTMLGDTVASARLSRIQESEGTSGNYGGTAEEYWHIMEYPSPGGCPEDPEIFYWEDCPSVGPWPGQGIYDSWNTDTVDNSYIAPLARVSDLDSVWGILYKKVSYNAVASLTIDYASYYATPAGTYQDPYKTYIEFEDTGIQSVEVRWKDSFGGDILIDSWSSSTETPGFYANGTARLYQVDGKNIFVFGYDRDYRIRGALSTVGISVDGIITLTNVSDTIVAGNKTYNGLYGAQHMGILKRSYTTKLADRSYEY